MQLKKATFRQGRHLQLKTWGEGSIQRKCPQGSDELYFKFSQGKTLISAGFLVPLQLMNVTEINRWMKGNMSHVIEVLTGFQ